MHVKRRILYLYGTQAERGVRGIAHGKNVLPFTKFFQYIKHFLWLFGQTVLTQLFQFATDDMEQTNSTPSVTKKQVVKQTAALYLSTKSGVNYSTEH